MTDVLLYCKDPGRPGKGLVTQLRRGGRVDWTYERPAHYVPADVARDLRRDRRFLPAMRADELPPGLKLPTVDVYLDRRGSRESVPLLDLAPVAIVVLDAAAEAAVLAARRAPAAKKAKKAPKVSDAMKPERIQEEEQ